MSYNKIKIFLLLITISSAGLISCSKTSHPGPINVNASPEAKALLDFLYQIKGKYILSGHHSKQMEPSKYNYEVKNVTGKYPAVWGSDFSYNFYGKSPDSIRQAITDTAKVMYSKGNIITLMWHSCYPENGDSCAKSTIWIWDDVIKQAEWDSLTTDGSSLNLLWKKQADNVAKYLKQLNDAGIPVPWRPYHEMNGIWFWWCRHPGEQGYVKLWRMMFDYFTNHHHLNNLLWVWNTNAPRNIPGDEAYDYVDYFPGTAYVDVLAADVYRYDYKQSHHDQLLKLADGKPIALGEVGKMPMTEILDKQMEWTWFMGWSEFLYKANSSDSVRTLYNYPRTITADEIVRNKDGSYSVRPD
jgi:mannan endo-1,4-beta-mannosidase